MQTRMRWIEAKLGAVATIERHAVSPANIAPQATYVGLEHIAGDGAITARTVEAGELRSGKFAFSERHILYGKLRPYLRKIARPTAAGICSTDILPILPGPDLDRDYLFHWLRQPRIVTLATARSDGVNLPRVSPRTLLELSFSLPSLDEQRRIAAILDKADAVQRKQRERMGLLDEFLRSTFVEMFGNPITNPKRWNVGPLGSLTSKIGSGATPTGGNTAYKESGICLIRSLNVRDGVFSARNLAHIDQRQAAKLSNVVVVENDVLLNITGASVARVCRAPASVTPARVNQHVCIIRPTGALSSHFLEHFLLSAATKRKLLGIAASGATRQAITKTQLENFLVPVPPVELQQRFVDIADRMEALRSKAMHSGWTCEELYRSLALTSFSSNTEPLLTL